LAELTQQWVKALASAQAAQFGKTIVDECRLQPVQFFKEMLAD
jgi:hypothetical protein